MFTRLLLGTSLLLMTATGSAAAQGSSLYVGGGVWSMGSGASPVLSSVWALALSAGTALRIDLSLGSSDGVTGAAGIGTQFRLAGAESEARPYLLLEVGAAKADDVAGGWVGGGLGLVTGQPDRFGFFGEFRILKFFEWEESVAPIMVGGIRIPL